MVTPGRPPRTKLAKMYVPFTDWINQIQAHRIQKGLDKRWSPPTIQRKMLKSKKLIPLQEELMNARFINDDFGQFDLSSFGIFRVIIISFIAVLFFGGLIYIMGILNTQFQAIGTQYDLTTPSSSAGYVNLTQAANNTFGQANAATQGLTLVAIAIIFGEILITIVSAAFGRKHPVLFIVWMFIVFLAIMLAAPIANAYETILNSGIYNGGLYNFTAANWLLLNLPTVTLFIGIFAAILMFINLIRPQEATGL